MTLPHYLGPTRTKQSVALTERNTTGPPRAAPGELRCAVHGVLQTTTDASDHY